MTLTPNIPSGSFKLPSDHPVSAPIKKVAAELHAALEAYLPIDRSPGLHTYEGLEMVMQNSKDKRFGVIGLMAVASRVITTLEGKVDGRFEGFVDGLGLQVLTSTNPAKAKNQPNCISKPKCTKPTKNNPVELLKLTHPHQKKIRRVKLGKGLAFVKMADLRRLELENHVYRRHNSCLEEAVFEKNTKMLMDMLEEVREGGAAAQEGEEVQNIETVDLMDGE